MRWRREFPGPIAKAAHGSFLRAGRGPGSHLGNEDFIERGNALVDNAPLARRLLQSGESAAVERAVHSCPAVPAQHARERGGLRPRLRKTQGQAAVRFLDVVERRAQRDPPWLIIVT